MQWNKAARCMNYEFFSQNAAEAWALIQTPIRLGNEKAQLMLDANEKNIPQLSHSTCDNLLSQS